MSSVGSRENRSSSGMYDVVSQVVAQTGRLDPDTFQMVVEISYVARAIHDHFQLENHQLKPEQIAESIATHCNIKSGWVTVPSLFELLRSMESSTTIVSDGVETKKKVFKVEETIQRLTTRTTVLEKECSRLQDLYQRSEIGRERAVKELTTLQTKYNAQIEYRNTAVAKYEEEYESMLRERESFCQQRKNFQMTIDREVSKGVKREAILQSCCRELARLKQKKIKADENIYATHAKYNTLMKEHREVQERLRNKCQMMDELNSKNQSLLKTIQKRLDENQVWKERVVDLEMQLDKVLNELSLKEAKDVTFVVDLDQAIIDNRKEKIQQEQLHKSTDSIEGLEKEQNFSQDGLEKIDEEEDKAETSSEGDSGDCHSSGASRPRGKKPKTKRGKQLAAQKSSKTNKRDKTKVFPPSTEEGFPIRRTKSLHEKSRSAARVIGKFVGLSRKTGSKVQ